MNNNGTKGKKRDYIAFFIVSFILIFLTSSFVIEDIYNNVDNIDISPAGVQMIYESSIGAIPSESDTKDNSKAEVQEENATNEVQNQNVQQEQTGTQQTE